MADLINLRQARKVRDRKVKDATAEANRARYGRTKAERIRQEAEHTQVRRHLDGHVLERAGEGTEDSES